MSFFKTVIAKMRRKPSCSKLSEILLSCSNSEIRFCFRSDKNKNKYFDCCTTAKEATEICRILGNINLCCPEKDKNFIKYKLLLSKYYIIKAINSLYFLIYPLFIKNFHSIIYFMCCQKNHNFCITFTLLYMLK